MSVAPVTMAAVATRRAGGARARATSNTHTTTTTNHQRRICGRRTSTATPALSPQLESTVTMAAGAQAATRPPATRMSHVPRDPHAPPRTRPFATTPVPCPHLQERGVTRAPRPTPQQTTHVIHQATTMASAPDGSHPTTRAPPAGSSSSRTSRASRPPGSLALPGLGHLVGLQAKAGSLGQHCPRMHSRASGRSFSSNTRRRRPGQASSHL